MGLPQADDLTSLVLRTDFSDDRAWEAVQTIINASAKYPSATYVSDPAYAGANVQALVDADSIADDDEKLFYVFIADEIIMADAEHPLLAVDLADEPGRTFRVLPRWYIDISANLCIANLAFADFADAVNNSGTYRGLGGIRTVEAQLGHRLPRAYVALARRHNGGSFARDACPAPSRPGLHTWSG